jgi:hypothetical protein
VWEKSPSLPVNQLMYNEVRYMGAALFDEPSFVDTITTTSSRDTCEVIIASGFSWPRKVLEEHPIKLENNFKFRSRPCWSIAINTAKSWWMYSREYVIRAINLSIIPSISRSIERASPTGRPAPGSLGKRTVAEVLGSLYLEASLPQKARVQS